MNVPPASVIETHISTVIMVGDRAYKLKKPVHFPFVDLRTRKARETLCHREVELNRRLAPDVYLGVADVTGPDGQPCDHLVVMRRMPAERRLSTLVADRDPRVPAVLAELGTLLARFHADANRSAVIDSRATTDAIAKLWQDNFDEMRGFVGDILDPTTFDRAVTSAREFIDGRGPLFDLRITEGCICDGHGDLQTDDVFCLDDGPRVLDCIEFCDDFRHGDVVNDLAFLVMDLERLGAVDLVPFLLESYEREAGRPVPAALLRFYVAYRAQVRAKVACLAAAQLGVDDPSRESLRRKAADLMALCLRALGESSPRLILVGGLPGTGKSTVARNIGLFLGVAVLRSDVVRKQLHNLDSATSAHAHFGQGIYNSSATERMYTDLIERANTELSQGRSVVIDASFNDTLNREQARNLASRTKSRVLELRCTLPRSEADQRMTARRQQGTDASDADASIAAAMAVTTDPWPEAIELATHDAADIVATNAIALLADH